MGRSGSGYYPRKLEEAAEEEGGGVSSRALPSAESEGIPESRGLTFETCSPLDQTSGALRVCPSASRAAELRLSILFFLVDSQMTQLLRMPQQMASPPVGGSPSDASIPFHQLHC